MSPYNVFVSGPKFTKFTSPNVEGVVVDQILFRFAIEDLLYSSTGGLLSQLSQLNRQKDITKNNTKITLVKLVSDV